MELKMKEMADLLVVTIRVWYIAAKNDDGDKRKNPRFREWKGMERALKALGISLEYEYSEDNKITAVIVGGYRAEM